MVPYWKQGVLTAMVAATLLAAVEGALWAHYALAVTECDVTNSPASAASMPIGLRKQVCDDHMAMRYGQDYGYPEQPRLLAPDQEFETVRINGHGFRGPDIGPKPDGAYRIAVLGGSTVFGSGVPDSQTIPAHLQDMLEGTEVINAGIPSATSFTELWLAENVLPGIGPDLVVVYGGYNDAGRLPDNPGVAHRAHLAGAGPAEDPPRAEWTFKTREFLGHARKQAQDAISWAAGAAPPSLAVEPSADRARVWQERVEGICRIGGELGFRTAVFLQPAADERNSPRGGEGPELASRLAQMEIMSGYLDMDGCDVVADLRRALDGAGPVFTDHVHLSGEGNRLMAGHIYSHIAGLLREAGAIAGD